MSMGQKITKMGGSWGTGNGGRRLNELRIFTLKRMLRGGHVAVFNYLMKTWREDEVRFLSEVHSDSTTGSRNCVVTQDILIRY